MKVLGSGVGVPSVKEESEVEHKRNDRSESAQNESAQNNESTRTRNQAGSAARRTERRINRPVERHSLSSETSR